VECKKKVIPITTATNVIISTSFRKYLSHIPGKHEIKDLEKRTMLGIAHMLQKVLM